MFECQETAACMYDELLILLGTDCYHDHRLTAPPSVRENICKETTMPRNTLLLFNENLTCFTAKIQAAEKF